MVHVVRWEKELEGAWSSLGKEHLHVLDDMIMVVIGN